MISVLLSVQPRWVDKICNVIGYQRNEPIYEKGDEVRKSRPNLSVPFKVYIYESRRRKKVIGHFICDLITAIKAENRIQAYYNNTKKTCLSDDELIRYADGKKVYFWHISALKIYDKPRELSEFKRPCPVSDCQECKFALWQTQTFISESKIVGCTQKIKAPQSWCYVLEVEP